MKGNDAQYADRFRNTVRHESKDTLFRAEYDKQADDGKGKDSARKRIKAGRAYVPGISKRAESG